MLLTLAAAPLWAQDKIVAVHAHGSHRFSAAEIIAAAGLPAGAPYTPDAVAAAAHRLADSGAFREIDPLTVPAYGGVILDWNVTDAPRFLPVRFSGFAPLTAADIARALAAIPLYRGALPLLKPGLTNQVTAALRKLLAARHLPGRVEHHYVSRGGEIVAVLYRVVR